MDGISFGTPVCDNIDLMLMNECKGEEFIKYTEISCFVGIPSHLVWHRLVVLAKFGYIENDPVALFFRVTEKGRAVINERNVDQTKRGI